MYRIILGVLIVFVLLQTNNASAQHFADEMHFSSDGRRLILGNQPYTGFYDLNTIHTINIQFSDTGFWTTLTNNYSSRTDIPATVTVDGVVYDSVGVRFKGNSSYTAIGAAEKKSFNMTFNSWKHGQNVGGYSVVVLNNCFHDPSFMTEVIYELQISEHVAAPHGNFSRLYINGNNWGIYNNVQQINNDFLKEWFVGHEGALWRGRNPPGSTAIPGSNGDSLSSLYDFGTDTTFYMDHYHLKSSGIPDPWTKLMTAIRVLDTTSAVNVESLLGDYLDIDAALWLLASENVFSDGDGYLFKGRKDYYVYYEPETGRLIPLEIDGNDAYKTSQVYLSVLFNSTNLNLPLVSKLLDKPQLKQRFLAHMRTIINDELDISEQDSIIDAFYSMIDTIVYNDPKKLCTYADFVNERQVLKQWVDDKRGHLLSDADIMKVGPVISNTVFNTNNIAWQRPTAVDDVWVTTNITSASGISRVSLYTSINLSGKFLKTVMYDDGQHQDQLSGDGIYGAMIPAKPGATWVRFYIEAAANNSSKTVSYDPEGAEHDVYTYLTLPSAAINPSIVINEVMAKNTSTAADSSGHYEDWIELYNSSNQLIDISGYYLTDSILNLMKWQIPQGTFIPANDYLIIWADENKQEGNFHTNFKLSSSQGEKLLLLNSNKELVDQVIFGPQSLHMGYARVPNGTGSFIIHPPSFNANNSAGVNVQIFEAGDIISVYPNPVNDKLTLKTGIDEILPLRIFNSFGEEIFSADFAKSILIETDKWADGIYFLDLPHYSKKFVVSH